MPVDELAKERRELLESAFDALNRRDHAALMELIPEDAEFRSAVGAVEGSGVFRGPEEFMQLYDTLLRTWDDLEWHLDSVEGSGERTAILYRLTGIAKESRVPLEQRLGQVWTWRDGEAAPSLVEIYTDPREALAAAGLGG